MQIAGINHSNAFVLILSGSAVASGHVGKELERASSKRKPILALRMDKTPLTRTFEYFLSESQWTRALFERIAQRIEQEVRAALAFVRYDIMVNGIKG
jgi:hypothetical protein